MPGDIQRGGPYRREAPIWPAGNVDIIWVKRQAIKQCHLPFWVFANVIRREAKVRADPSFNLFSSHSAPVRRDEQDRHGKTISVHKIQVSSTENTGDQKKPAVKSAK
jgi:hypothetical protein